MMKAMGAMGHSSLIVHTLEIASPLASQMKVIKQLTGIQTGLQGPPVCLEESKSLLHRHLATSDVVVEKFFMGF